MSRVSAFVSTEQKTMKWLEDIAKDMGSPDTERAYKTLRAVLHALRDRMMPDEAVQLGAQLPMLIRGFYYEGWNPHSTPERYRHKKEFIETIRESAPELDDVQAERAASAVFGTLERQMPGGELDQVRHALPEEIRELWPAESE